MQDTIYYLIIVIYYFWYFYVKTVILGLGDLFPCFQVHLILFRSNLVLVMEEDPQIKIIVEGNSEAPIIEKGVEVEMVETIEEEIEEESFKDLNEIKSYDC